MGALGSCTDVISYAECGCEDASEMPGDSPNGEGWVCRGTASHWKVFSQNSLSKTRKSGKSWPSPSPLPILCLPQRQLHVLRQALPERVREPAAEQGRASASRLCFPNLAMGYGLFPTPSPCAGFHRPLGPPQGICRRCRGDPARRSVCQRSPPSVSRGSLIKLIAYRCAVG